MAFTLRIFESEFEEMERFVVKYPNIETGGDLFGLWAANGDPVVQLIIGPGKNCKRTSVSFHQDTDYLGTVGRFVNSSYMLCHIGSWHSHHQLSLTQPSAGDRSTVCNNFPVGLQRYIMIIANIERGQFVKLHPYMFTKEGHVCKLGKVQKISGASPFREDGYILNHLVSGAEKHAITDENAYLSRVPDDYHRRSSTHLKPKDTKTKIDHSENCRSFEQPASTSANVLNSQSHSPTRVGISKHDKSPEQPSTQSKVPSSESNSPTRAGFSENRESFEEPSTCLRSVNCWTKSSNIKSQTNDVCHEPMDIDSSGDDRDINVTRQQPGSHYQYSEVSKTTKSHHHRSHVQGTSSGANFEDTNSETQWYDTKEGGTKLKEIAQQIESTNIARDVEYSRDTKSKDLIMTFCHASQTWTIVFPKAFDNDAALITNGSGEKVLSRNVIQDLRKVCKCGICQHYKSDCQPSFPKQKDEVLLTPQTPRFSSKKNRSSSRKGHYSPYPKTTPARRFAECPTQPWFNSSSGKETFEHVKSDLEAYLKASNNVSKVKITAKPGFSKELTFYHDNSDWIVRFKESSQDIAILKKKYGEEKCVAVLTSPRDVVSELQKHCPCAYCRPAKRPRTGQKRPGSTHTGANTRFTANDVSRSTLTGKVCPRGPSRASSTQEEFFARQEGEEKFRRICTDIHTLLHARNVDVSRVISSKEIRVTFEHGDGYLWRLYFPFDFPRKLPELACTRLRGNNAYTKIAMKKVEDIFPKIRLYCQCRSCIRYPTYVSRSQLH